MDRLASYAAAALNYRLIHGSFARRLFPRLGPNVTGLEPLESQEGQP